MPNGKRHIKMKTSKNTRHFGKPNIQYATYIDCLAQNLDYNLYLNLPEISTYRKYTYTLNAHRDCAFQALPVLLLPSGQAIHSSLTRVLIVRSLWNFQCLSMTCKSVHIPKTKVIHETCFEFCVFCRFEAIREKLSKMWNICKLFKLYKKLHTIIWCI